MNALVPRLGVLVRSAAFQRTTLVLIVAKDGKITQTLPAADLLALSLEPPA